MEEALTQGIRVEVESEYLIDKSNPQNGEYFFTYHIKIANEGAETVQLLSRHWIIKDGEGNSEEVKGKGVVGEQPILESGESFEYTSFCPLKTPMGTMQGTYQMKSASGELFDIAIPQFELKTNYTLH